jgi:hypothetical protein
LQDPSELNGDNLNNIRHETSRLRRLNNIEMNLGEIGYCGVDWINLARDKDQWMALMKTVMNFRVP